MKRTVLVAMIGAALAALTSAATVYDIYRVQPGDTLDSIARTYGLTVAELRDLNPGLSTGALTASEAVTVPVRATATSEANAEPASHGATAANGVDTSTTLSSAKVLGADGQPEGEPAPKPEVAAAPAVAVAAGTPGRRSFAVNGALGRLGEMSGAHVPIYRDRQSGGQRLFTAPAGTRVLVVSQVDSWYGIRMLDGSIGWAETEFVKLTDTELLAGAGAGSSLGMAIVQSAWQYMGVPYRWGGTSMSGIDCSGLVLRAYQAHGINLPRTAREQINVGTPVPIEQLQPGDRIYFSGGGEYVDHTGLYIGNGQFIHASGRRQAVGVDNLFDQRYTSIYVGARR